MMRLRASSLMRRIARLPLGIIEGVSRAIGHEAPRTNPQDQQLHDQTEELLISPGESYFLNLFERKYGTAHPFFYACSFAEALKMAKNESKFVFAYLHAPSQPFTDTFCRDTLCSELVIQFLDANFVSWGAVVNREEGFQIAVALKASSFPFCAVVAPASGDSIAILQQVEEPVSPEALVEILQRTIEEQGSAFKALRQEEEERIRANRQLRQEQDAAYIAALQMDKEKDRARELQAEEAARTQAEAKKANDDGLHKKLDLKPSRSTREEASKEDQRLKRLPAPKQSSNKAKEASKETRAKQTTTLSKTQPYTKILIRFPNGQRMEQSFLNTDTIRSVYKYIDSLDIPGLGSYRLIGNFPRKAYGYEQLDMTLEDAGFHPNLALFLELLS